MVDVTQSGTARAAFRDTPYQAAGKTGTAQVFSLRGAKYKAEDVDERLRDHALFMAYAPAENPQIALALLVENADRKSTRLNSSHVAISYAVFCLKKKKR